MFQIEYDFRPDARVYVVLEEDNSIQAGAVTQLLALVHYQDTEDDTDDDATELITKIEYLVLVNGDVGSTELPDERVFETLDEAIVFVQTLITPTPTPVVTPTPTPTPSAIP